MRIPLLAGAVIVPVIVTFADGIRYVSTDGDDANDGMTERTAWRTLSRLARGLPAGGEGRLRRGDVFYSGRVVFRPGADSAHRTRITAWGMGAKPIVSAYMMPRRDVSTWKNTGSNLWSYVPRSDKALRGNVYSVNGNIGFLKVDGRIFGRKFFSKDSLARQWDFHDDHVTLTVWSTKNPAEAATDIKLAPDVRIFDLADHLEFRDIEIAGTGGHGISGIGCDVRIADCVIREIGGSHLAGHGTGVSRYGNGIECWAGSRDVRVNGCRISDVYDVAFTMQGRNPPHSWENIHVEDCVIIRCTQAIEIWARKCPAEVGFRNCTFRRNLCIDTSRNWGYDVRPDRINGAPLLLYAVDTDTCDLLIEGNRFVNSRGALVSFWRGLGMLPKGYHIVGNRIEGDMTLPVCCQNGSDARADRMREMQIKAENTFSQR